jgi:RNA polymerase sigma-70 factor (ECF subfamily)
VVQSVRHDRLERDVPPAGSSDRPIADFDEIYREHFPYVWRTLRRLGVAMADLEDVTHEVFVVVHRRLADFDGRRPVKPWLFGIAYRLASEDRRRAHRRYELAAENLDPPALGARADDLIERDERRRLVLECLQVLAIEQRAVLILLDIDGEAAADVAAAMNIPLPTVYSRLRVAREKFAAAVRRVRLRRGET